RWHDLPMGRSGLNRSIEDVEEIKNATGMN
ncbi:hypothetical protein ABIA85_009830, partial [Bradyrhizobium sp. LA6.10]